MVALMLSVEKKKKSYLTLGGQHFFFGVVQFIFWKHDPERCTLYARWLCHYKPMAESEWDGSFLKT